ncbi:MAG: acylphosphatase [Halobacteria archaeon]
MSELRAHVWISGKVQGVYYRANTRDEARSRDVNGWVKNLPDGRVEAVFEGEEDTVKEMIEWCHEGSDRANVKEVEVDEGDPTGLDGFEIRY